MWRLLLGEMVWALRQLAAEPLVPLGMVVGFVVTLLVLDAAAPGPVLEGLWRMVVAVVAGHLVGSGAAWLKHVVANRRSVAGGEAATDDMPVVGATVIAGVATVALLLAWLVVWLLELLR